MNPPDAPLPNPPAKKRNMLVWGCGGCLALLVVGGLAVGAFIFFGVVQVIKSSAPYQTALSKAQNSPEVQEELGTPIKDGFMPSGSVKVENDTGTAEFTIPLSGSKGSGTIHYKATKSGETWTPSELNVKVDADGKVIDISK